MSRNIGGSILPSSAPHLFAPLVGKNGSFHVRASEEMDTHFLFFTPTGADPRIQLIAEHPNGYSCHVLAKRIVAAQEGTTPVTEALSQLDYIVACGGKGAPRELVEALAYGR